MKRGRNEAVTPASSRLQLELRGYNSRFDEMCSSSAPSCPHSGTVALNRYVQLYWSDILVLTLVYIVYGFLGIERRHAHTETLGCVLTQRTAAA